MLFSKVRLIILTQAAFLLAMVVAAPLYAQEEVPHLHIYKTATSKNANVGEQIQFEIEPQVHRSPTATNVVVTDVLPDGTTFVRATGGGVYDAPSNTVTWNLPLLVEGETPVPATNRYGLALMALLMFVLGLLG